MFSAIYYESEIENHPRVRGLRQRYAQLPQVPIGRYGEIFNRKNQNFRLQKQHPALVLARKHGKLVLPAPPGYGFDADQSFYFSHMLNCLYDCRYCFLQGMFRSAHYVLFVNYEDFGEEIRRSAGKDGNQTVFYSGYDCDSLALDPVSEFSDYILPLFADLPDATLELRTKSTQVRKLLNTEPIPNVVVAMSFTAQEAAEQWEHKVPPTEKRLEALVRLQQAGWRIALRFEPVFPGLQEVGDFSELFDQLFGALDVPGIHSVSLGEFRMPPDYFKITRRLYPDNGLLARDTRKQDDLLHLYESEPGSLLANLEQELLSRIETSQYYRCA